MLRGVLTHTVSTSSEKSRASKLHSPNLIKRAPPTLASSQDVEPTKAHLDADPRSSLCKHNKFASPSCIAFLIYFILFCSN
jgi:hypothetical protein